MDATYNYIAYAHGETKRSVPEGLKALWVKALSGAHELFATKSVSKSVTVSKPSFIERVLNSLIDRLIRDFVSINLEVQAINEKMEEGTLIIANPDADYETVKKIINLLRKANNTFERINYFDNQNLEQEIISSLNNLYLIEVKLKNMVFANRKSEPKKDSLFELLALKSNESLSRAL